MAMKVKFLVSRDIPSLKIFLQDEVAELEDDMALDLARQGFVEIKKDKHKKKHIEAEDEIKNNE